MPLEIRQLVIRSTVDPSPDTASPDGRLPETLEQLRDEILAECESLFDEKLRQLRER
jgi:hypothetical protein